MADLNNNNSFDSNLGAGLMPAYGNDMSWDFSTSAFTSINNPSAGSQRTVSPKDIFQDPLGSAPPSTAFTNLTSPDINESPFITDSIECSPAFTANDSFSTDNWYSLFPEENNESALELERSFSTASMVTPAAPVLERTISTTSMARSNSSSTNSPALVENTSAHRRKSSVNGSPATNGVSKSRRRKGPLPPISVDPTDKVALKRARNTLAARDSRQRKFEHVQVLEKRNAELEVELERWKAIALAQGYTGA